jgi:hypothetical protein
MFKIKWTNKFSGETGFVADIKRKAGHFVSTFEAAEAKAFKNAKNAEKAIKTLAEIGEADNNNFEIVEA